MSSNRKTISTTALSSDINSLTFYNDPEKVKSIVDQKKKSICSDIFTNKASNKSYIIINRNKKTEVIGILNGSKFAEISPKHIKFFDYFKCKLYEGAYNTRTHKLQRDSINITIDELVKYRIYDTSNREVVIRNLKESKTFMMNLYSMVTKKGDDIDTHECRRLISGHYYYKGGCVFYLEAKYQWKDLLRYYATLPETYFLLPIKSYYLVQQLLTMARSRASRMDVSTIRLEVKEVVDILGLSITTKNPTRDIKQPLQKITSEINQTVKEVRITLPDDAPFNIYLRESVTIEFKGEIRKLFSDLAKTKTRNIKRNLSKKMESEKTKADKVGG